MTSSDPTTASSGARARVAPALLRVLVLATLCVLAVLVLSGCASVAPGSTIDGWEIGQPVDCGVQTTGFCEKYLRVASSGLDEMQSGHAVVLQSRLYEDARQLTRSGGPILIAVFQLADGSAHAVGVGNMGIGPVVAWDPSGQPHLPVNQLRS